MQWQGVLAGEMTEWQMLVAPNNEHRVIPIQAAFIVDYLIFSGRLIVPYAALFTAQCLPPPTEPTLVSALEKQARFALLSNNVRTRPPNLIFMEDTVFAHAPSRVRIPVRGSALHVEFGLRAYDYPASADGVCFSAADPDGLILWQRCLDPHTAGDIGPQRATLSIRAGLPEITLETWCRKDCGYDWSYWSQAYYH